MPIPEKGQTRWVKWTPELLERFVDQLKYEGIPHIDLGCKFCPTCDCGKGMYKHDGSWFCPECGLKI